MEGTWFPPAADLLSAEHNGDVALWAATLNANLKKTLFDPYAKVYVWQLEQAPTTGAYHAQIFVNLKGKMRTGELAGKVGGAGKLPGITFRPCSIAGKEAIEHYCSKDETRVAGPFSNRALPKKVTGWDVKEITETPFPWQKLIIDDLKTDCKDDRCINWVYDPQGCSGKTKLCKFCEISGIGQAVQYGGARDLSHLLYQQERLTGLLIDLTRAKPKDFASDDMYSVMEAAKNGMIQNTKYETGKKIFDPPHVWVFANQKPEFTKLTTDRWRVWCINSNAELIAWKKKGDTPTAPRRTLQRAASTSTLDKLHAGVDESQVTDTEEDDDDDDLESTARQRAGRSSSAAEEKERVHRRSARSRSPPPRNNDFKRASDHEDVKGPVIRDDDLTDLTDEDTLKMLDALEAAHMRNVRVSAWRVWEAAVAKKWGEALQLDAGTLQDFACMHNVWGCEECDTAMNNRRTYDPPK